MEELSTCPWCLSSELYKSYHDQEWGRPVREETKMFEFLLLETFQAGLSWITVLNKREEFRKAFHSFDMHRVAAMTDREVANLMQNAGIIRHEAKIRAAISIIIPKINNITLIIKRMTIGLLETPFINVIISDGT